VGQLRRNQFTRRRFTRWNRKLPGTQPAGLSFVALNDSGVVGSLMVGHDGKRGYIQHLAVATTARRQGVAAALVERCLEALRAQGIVKSHVHVINSNQLGRDFWSRRGWHHRAEIEMYSFINGDNKNA